MKTYMPPRGSTGAEAGGMGPVQKSSRRMWMVPLRGCVALLLALILLSCGVGQEAGTPGKGAATTEHTVSVASGAKVQGDTPEALRSQLDTLATQIRMLQAEIQARESALDERSDRLELMDRELQARETAFARRLRVVSFLLLGSVVCLAAVLAVIRQKQRSRPPAD